MYKFSHLLYKLRNGVDTDDILISNKQFKKIHIDYHKYDKSLVKLLLSKHYNELKMAFEQKDKFIIVRSFDGNYLILDVLSEFIIKNEYLINEGYLTEKEVKRFNYLKSFLSYDKALEQINDTSFQYYYQQSYREMDVSKVINLLELNPDELKKILTNNSEKQLDEELIIMLLTFINKYICVSYYIYPDNMQQNIQFLKSLSFDYNVLEEIKLKDKPEFLKRAKLKSDFKDRIIKSIPEQFNSFEKIFYLYVKLCRTLSHDELDLTVRDQFIINHKDIDRIQEIDEENNVIVCYEFITVLALFFDLLGVKYEIVGNEQYAKGHLAIKVVDGDALIYFEPTNGLYNSDLTKIKNNIRACGVTIEQANPKEVDRISASIEKVYNYLENEKKQSYSLESELIKAFRARINNISSISDETKLRIFMEEISKLPYNNILDIIKGMKIWDKVLFKRQNVFTFSEILLKASGENDDYDKVGVVISFNPNGLDSDNKDDFNYYLYTFPHSFIPISGDQLVDNLNSGKYEYLRFINSMVPGIETEEMKKNNERIQIIFG